MSRTDSRHRRSSAAAPLLALLSTLFCGCTSTEEAPEPEPWVSRDNRSEDVSIGKLLADLDARVQAWSSLSLTASTAKQRTQAVGIEKEIMRLAKPVLEDLIVQLQTGPPRNRIRAAAPLGFTRLPEAQSPLLAALEDPQPDVVHNALLGLAVLQRGDTPMGPICAQLRDNPDGQIRSNAAYAMLSIIEVGGSSDCALPSSLQALSDSEPFVRGQAALLVCALGGGDEIDRVAELLYEEPPFVCVSAARGLAQLGHRREALTGQVARVLADAHYRVTVDMRPRLHEALVVLRGEDPGADPTLWVEWAYALP